MPRRPAETASADRFSEQQAAQAIQRGTPDLEAGVAAIRNTIATLDRQPGVYRMTDAAGDVLYVGKARALRPRVASYVQVARLPRRLQRMVAQTRGMEVIVTASEAQALLLEAQLIKRFRPPFNVLLRDDKSFPFIALDEGHAFARLSKHRGQRRPNTLYWGPFASAGSVARTLNALQKLFGLRSCSDSEFARRERPCLLHQIRRCTAPCVGRIDEESYGRLVADTKAFLGGRSREVQERLQQDMRKAADARDYERAAMLRDRLRALTFIQGNQALQLSDEALDADVVALHRQDGVTGIQIFFVRGGQNWGHRALFPSHAGEIDEAEVLSQFLAQFYTDLEPARLILLDRPVADAGVLAEALATRAGRALELRVPQRGPLRTLVESARKNAVEAVERRLAEGTTQSRHLEALAEFLELDAPPERIEVYDNSHVQGASPVGALIVAGPQGFLKGSYRKFNMRGPFAPGDDFAMMREMLARRFRRLAAEDPERLSGEWPDLVMIDGGRGQVSAALEVLRELGIEEVAVVGIAKGPDRHAGREVFHLSNGRERMLPTHHPLLYFLQRLRDEAHRFAIGAHRARRTKAMTVSTLDEVPGIGPSRKKALLHHFGTARAVKAASADELARAPGISRTLAESLYRHFHPGA